MIIDANASVRTLPRQFDAIKVSGGINLFLSQSDNVAIAVSAGNENYKAGIKTVIEDGTLKIFYKGENNRRKKDGKLRVYGSFKYINKLEASGASDVLVTGIIHTASLAIQMSRACDFSGKLKVDVLKLNLSGASDARISGTAGTAVMQSTGASDIKYKGTAVIKEKQINDASSIVKVN